MGSLAPRIAALAFLAVVPVARGQTAAAARTDSARIPWVSRGDLEQLGVALVATAALAPMDHAISREFFEPHWLGSATVQHAAGTVAFFGGDGPIVMSAVLYAGGAAFHANALSRAALHNVEAIALAVSITGLGKGIAGRALPGVATDESFSFGRGFHRNNGPFVSFPSGHATAAFAMATTLDGEIARVRPDIAATARPLLFAGATAVGIARVVQRVHWPSDLPLAAAIGMWSGRTVEAHATRRGLVAKALGGVSIAPAASGRTMLAWSSRASDDNLGEPR